MRVFVNGEAKDLEAVSNVSGLVAELGLTPAMVLIEHNGVALLRHEWDLRNVSPNDRFEILQVVAGG